jgi:hypothetical protein
MDWIALGVLGVIWAILLVPSPKRRTPPSPVRNEMPIDQEDFSRPGRWILSPRRGSRFVGTVQRERQRARERRRRVYVFLLEVIGVTGLIGMFPPLRGMLWITGIFLALLGVYTLLVMQVSNGRSLVRAEVATSEPRPQNVVRIPEIRTGPNPALEEQDRRLAKLAR